jgi:hypothetical protein
MSINETGAREEGQSINLLPAGSKISRARPSLADVRQVALLGRWLVSCRIATPARETKGRTPSLCLLPWERSSSESQHGTSLHITAPPASHWPACTLYLLPSSLPTQQFPSHRIASPIDRVALAIDAARSHLPGTSLHSPPACAPRISVYPTSPHRRYPLSPAPTPAPHSAALRIPLRAVAIALVSRQPASGPTSIRFHPASSSIWRSELLRSHHHSLNPHRPKPPTRPNT